jgi:hypothetical protein
MKHYWEVDIRLSKSEKMTLSDLEGHEIKNRED